MPYDVHVTPNAKFDIGLCFDYLRDYSDEFADVISDELNHIMYKKLPDEPLMWSYFHLTGEPYRAYLYKIGKKTTYWLVYRVNQQENRIDILRFWNSAQNPLAFKV